MISSKRLATPLQAAPLLLSVLALSVLLICSASASEPQGAAVIGSYRSPGAAKATQIKARAILRDVGQQAEVRIADASISGKRWSRILVVPPAHRHGREIVSLFREKGFPDAWFLADVAPSSISSSSVSTDTSQPSDQSLVQEQDTQIVAVARTSQPASRQVITSAAMKTTLAPGELMVLGEQDGIPFHRLSIKTIPYDQAGVTLDGEVNEPIWQTIQPHDNMIVSVPGKGTPGEYPTELRLLATEKGLYASSIMYQPPETLVKRYSTRDDFIDRDSFGITLDMSGEGLVGYWYIIALGDSMMDGKVLPERNYQMDWDGPWTGKTAVRNDGWSMEMFLPWSMMAMPETGSMRNIGFSASRQVSSANERYEWPGYSYSSARFVSLLNQIDVEGVQPRQQYSVIPFASSTLDQANGEEEARVGIDFSWRPSPKLQFTGSLLPDFGAVEADDVVVNLTASETFFPEKRLFFLEGNEVFENSPRANSYNIYRIMSNNDFGNTSRKGYSYDFIPTPISMMNTRRIGGTASQVTVPDGMTKNRSEENRPTDMLAATKVTGSVGDLRYGVLAAFEDDVSWYGTRDVDGDRVDIEDDGRDFAVTRFLYEDVGRDRKSFGYLGTMVSGPLYDAFVHGLDAHYTSWDGSLIVDAQTFMSDVDDVEGYGGLVDVMYSVNKNWQHKFELDYMNEDVNINDLGFLRRNDYKNFRYVMMYNKNRINNFITNYRSTVVAEQQWNLTEGQKTQGGLYWRNSLELPKRNTLKASFGYYPERYEDLDSRGNGAYRVKEGGWFNFNLATNAAKTASYSFGIGSIRENMGDWTYNASIGTTIRPIDAISIDFDLVYKRRKGWFVYQGGRNFGSYNAIEWQPRLKFNWFLAPGHQIRLSVQWAAIQAKEDGFWEIPAGDGDLIPGTRTKADHDFTVSLITAQLRYRWEIAPLTDLYIVYNLGNSLPNQTDGTFEDLFNNSLDEPTIDAFIAKLRYRFGN